MFGIFKRVSNLEARVDFLVDALARTRLAMNEKAAQEKIEVTTYKKSDPIPFNNPFEPVKKKRGRPRKIVS